MVQHSNSEGLRQRSQKQMEKINLSEKYKESSQNFQAERPIEHQHNLKKKNVPHQSTTAKFERTRDAEILECSSGEKKIHIEKRIRRIRNQCL